MGKRVFVALSFFYVKKVLDSWWGGGVELERKEERSHKFAKNWK